MTRSIPKVLLPLPNPNPFPNHLPTHNQLWQPTSTRRPADLSPASLCKPEPKLQPEHTQLRVSITDKNSGGIPREAAHPFFEHKFFGFCGGGIPLAPTACGAPPLANGSAPRNAPRPWQQPRPGHRCRAARRLRLTPPLSSHSATVSCDHGQPAKQTWRGIAIRYHSCRYRHSTPNKAPITGCRIDVSRHGSGQTST
jgi:hypothetical protein